jgi:ketol-acid reductoisomerase
MEATNNHLLESLIAVSAEVKSIHKRIENNSKVILKDDLAKCADIINTLIRDLDDE